MKTQIITITTMILLIATVSAINIYPGEVIKFPNDMGITNLVYTIIGNSTDVSSLEVEVNSTNITIYFPQDMIPDSFDIVFIEEKTNTIVQTVNVGGGGGGTRTVYKDREVPTILTHETIKEVPGEEVIKIETLTEEKIISKVPIWFIILFVLIIITLIIFMIREIRD